MHYYNYSISDLSMKSHDDFTVSGLSQTDENGLVGQCENMICKVLIWPNRMNRIKMNGESRSTGELGKLGKQTSKCQGLCMYGTIQPILSTAQFRNLSINRSIDLNNPRSIDQSISQSFVEAGTNKQRYGIVSGTTRHTRLTRNTYSSLYKTWSKKHKMEIFENT